MLHDNETSAPSSFPPITVGKVLGKGGYCVVREVALNSSENTRNHPSQHYVVKSLRQGSDIIDEREAEMALADLKREAKLLSYLSRSENKHKNIIQLHALITVPLPSSDYNYHDKQGRGEKYHLVLDRLESTLREKLLQWNHPMVTPVSQRKVHSVIVPSLFERLVIASEVALGLKHMHRHGIMHRDIKPDNIGFDVSGRARIFDLGFARRYNKDDRHMTGMIGTRRYMAPEIAKSSKHYDLSVDAYSFGLLLWEICAMEQPYEEFCSRGVEEFDRMVTFGGRRPHMLPHWSEELRCLLEGCWAGCPSDRLDFGEIVTALSSDDIAKLGAAVDDFNQGGNRHTTRKRRRQRSLQPWSGLNQIATMVRKVDPKI